MTCSCLTTTPLTTNYTTDLGNIFVSYADIQNLLCENSVIVTAGGISFYNTQIYKNRATL